MGRSSLEEVHAISDDESYQQNDPEDPECLSGEEEKQ